MTTKSRSACRLHARQLEQEESLLACFRLRYGYFVEQRRWVQACAACPGMERDSYDGWAWHFACFDEQGACAYLRALPWRPGRQFMLDKEFAPLLDEAGREQLRREGALELSRLVVRPGITMRSYQNEPHPIEWVLRSLYQRCLQENYNKFYIVVEAKWLAVLQRRFGLPFRRIGQPHVFPDDVHTVAATATLEDLRNGVMSRGEAYYRWYHQLEPAIPE